MTNPTATICARPSWQRFLSTFTVLVMILGIVPFASSQAVPTAVRVLSGDELNSHLRAETATFNGITSNIYNQDGLGFSGMIAPNPLANPVTMTGYGYWPYGFFIGDNAFIGGVFDGQWIWMIPFSASHVVRISKNTGSMTSYNDWPYGFTKGAAAFIGGVFDGQYIWMIPYSADRVIKVDKNTGAMVGYNNWPVGFHNRGMAFSGGVFDGQYIWMIPCFADRVIKINEYGTMTSYTDWPDGYTKRDWDFGSGVFDGQSIWMIPSHTDRVIKVDKDTGVMTSYNDWPDGFTTGNFAFGSGVFDGQSIWMIPLNADRVIKVDKDTGMMTGYNDWPDGFTGGGFRGGAFDGQSIWMIPFGADRVIKINKNTGAMTGYSTWPNGFTGGAFAGGAFDGQRSIWMIPYTADHVIRLSGIGNRPAAPVVTSPISGTLTNDATPTFTGTTEAGATIEIRDDSGTVLCTTVADGNGVWTCTPDEPLGEGEHALNVVAIDEMANESDPTPIIITVDTTPPAAPTVTSPISGTTVITNTPTFTGTGEPGGTVTIYNAEGDVVCTTTVVGDGSWTCMLSEPLDEGEQTCEVTITDVAGNESEPTPVTITVDTPPAAPIVTEPISGTAVSDPTPTFAGTTEPGATIKIRGDAGNVLCTTVADGNGAWMCTPNEPLGEGEHTLDVVAIDEGGNESEPTPITITVDTIAPAAPTVTEPISGTTISDPTPTFAGTAEPGTTVFVGEMQGTIFIALCEAVVDENGDWTCTSENLLSDGEHTLTVIAVDAAGNESEPTELTFTIKAAPEAQDDIYIVPEGVSSTLDVLENDSDPGGDILTITQVTVPSHGVAATDGATVAYTPTAGYLGTDNFTYTINDSIYEDTALVTVTVLPVADLAVTQTARGTFGTLEFTLVARNLGPRSANGAVVSDTFPANLGNVTWTCVSAGGAACPNANGTGHIEETLASFPTGGVVTYTIAADILVSTIEYNTVTITPPVGTLDLDMSNNSATQPTLYRIFLPLVLKNVTS